MASGIKGVGKVRAALRKAPQELQEPVRQAIVTWLEAVAQDARAGAPVDEGDLVRSIDYKTSADGFRGVAGPGASAVELAVKRHRAALKAEGKSGAGSPFSTRIASNEIRISATNKEQLWQYFKAYWHERGTKGSPEHNIRPLPARPFMAPAFLLNVQFGRALLQDAVGQALRKARG